MAKATGFDEELHGYLSAHRSPDDEILEALREETRQRVGGLARMQVAPEQGTFLSLLVAALGASSVVEVGTFTGYSALCMARSLPPAPEGRLLCCDVSQEWTEIGRKYWERAGVSDRIELVIAPAIETLKALPREEQFDFAFIDADKTSYLAYYQEILPRLRTNALLGVDNVLWSGNVIDVTKDDENTRAIREFNDFVAADDRVQSVMVAISDGLTLLRKL
jgi:caffeoyl-CoA O-methyltransferase